MAWPDSSIQGFGRSAETIHTVERVKTFAPHLVDELESGLLLLKKLQLQCNHLLAVFFNVVVDAGCSHHVLMRFAVCLQQ